MISKESEEVLLDKDCDCIGDVRELESKNSHIYVFLGTCYKIFCA